VDVSPLVMNIAGRLFGRKVLWFLSHHELNGSLRPHSGLNSSQARLRVSLRGAARPVRGTPTHKEAGVLDTEQTGKPVTGEDET